MIINREMKDNMRKEVTVSSNIHYLCSLKTPYMILIIDKETMDLTYFMSLIQACKYMKGFKYHTIKSKRLSTKPTKYKGMYIYRVNHS